MIDLRLGDCHEELEELEEDSVDAVVCDPPYALTSASWDSQPLDWNRVWKELHRACKREAPFVFTARQPFTTKLISSNIENFRHDLVWVKDSPTGALNAKKQPMPSHEDVVVFYRKAGKYNSGAKPMDKPEKTIRIPSESRDSIYQKNVPTLQTEKGHATSILKARRNQKQKMKHPTQKPVKLMGKLVKMYSDEGDVVLDFTCGSGSTGVAAINENRDFIGIEKDEEYFEIAKKRIENAKSQRDQFNKFFK